MKGVDRQGESCKIVRSTMVSSQREGKVWQQVKGNRTKQKFNQGQKGVKQAKTIVQDLRPGM
jgi:CII-binding regulator of phage lambda lysogenization HflD